MFNGLQHRIGLGAGRWRLPPAEQSPQTGQGAPQLSPQLIHRLQSKWQAGFLRRRLGRESRQSLRQPPPHQRRGQGVMWQHVSQENGKGLSTAAAPSAIGTKHALSARPLLGAIKRIIAVKNAVPVQSPALLAVRARQLLERKSCASSSWQSRTNRKNGRCIRFCCLSRTRFVQSFQTALPTAQLGSMGLWKGRGRH